MNTLIYTACLGLFCMLAEIFNLRKWIIPTVVLGLAVIFSLNLNDWNHPSSHYNDMLRVDNFSVAFSGLALLICTFLFMLSSDFYRSEENQKHISDYMAILVFVLCGALMMVSFGNLVMLFLGIETLSISLYVMAGSNRNDLRSNEAGFKYFLLGAFTSGFLLFGIALIYGASNSFNLQDIYTYVSSNGNNISPLFIVGMLLMIFAMLFKISAAPFHFWAPDVYEGSPALVTAFMSTLVKIAAFAAFYRLISNCFLFTLQKAELILTVSCIATLFIGNLTALVQDNFKRLLAFSGISHAGYMLLAIISLQSNTDSVLFYYATGYALSSIAAFAVVIAVIGITNSEKINSLNGLGKKNPILATLLTMAMLSLAGIPPFAGFFGKYFIFSEALRNGYSYLVLIAIINSIIGVYYYLKPVMAMYGGAANQDEIKLPISYSLVLWTCVILSLLLGIFPDLFVTLL